MLSVDLHYQWQTFHAHYQLSLPPGLTTLLGASGEGKSTLLQLIGGFIEGQGDLHWGELDLQPLPPYARPVTTLFQSDNLFPQLTVWQNVAIGLHPGMRLNSEGKERVDWALEQTQLTAYKENTPTQLSGGQAQRVALARVLVREKPILLLDEPFSALDPALRSEMLEQVAILTETGKLTTLLVSHHPLEAKKVGGRILFVDQGRIQLHGDVHLLNQPDASPAWGRYLKGT